MRHQLWGQTGIILLFGIQKAALSMVPIITACVFILSAIITSCVQALSGGGWVFAFKKHSLMGTGVKS